MRKAFKKAFQELKDVVEGRPDGDQLGDQTVSFNPNLPTDLSPSPRPRLRPTPQVILRYRYQHGTNLGGIFVLEQWLFGSMYDQGVSSSSELDAVVASINTRGLDETRRKWETHWSSALSDADLHWLTHSAHCNHIRLPIGYFTLGPAFCTHTAFATPHQASQVYVNAWTAVKELVARCSAHGIGVLLDLHGVPGGANHETHSGTSSGKAELWANAANLDLATRCVLFIAHEVTRDPRLAAVVGVQVCNEAIIDPPGMYEWYNDVIQRVSAVDSSLPLYISDGWDLGRALRFTRAYNNTVVYSHGPTTTGANCPVFVDCHKYWTFDDKDTSRSPTEIIEQVRTAELHELDASLVGDVFAHQAAVAVYIGEYSMALAPQTWARAGPDPQRKDELTRQFGVEQSNAWQRKAAGSAFWTCKMDWMPGWEWGFKHASDNGYVAAPKSLAYTVRQVRQMLARADAERTRLHRDAVAGHTHYWDTLNSNSNHAPAQFEHWRYADGWLQGWSDARDFFAARVDRYVPSILTAASVSGWTPMHSPPAATLTAQQSGPVAVDEDEDEDAPVGADLLGGALDLWILHRMRAEGLTNHQACPFGWEWEHGFRAGVRSFGDVVAVAN
ncbi:hypothetical protein A1O3_07524 [Capronia epimyces CBS 606.96]|uniref:Glycoside hydrolase family 5 domain-containing protein n=1 Tax=Capronia epimyces CBS 606.96 TaxID=1182542 RepID=W9YG14_9EURO|nr:uncharacterized protein A1O3_07524 [Capronia epimyces CBS 606.96]EXJ81234.1 hypothetical protein A1O3_07524 [Capronia epimyces CBS 606.96]